jgi:hypothetical protein
MTFGASSFVSFHLAARAVRSISADLYKTSKTVCFRTLMRWIDPKKVPKIQLLRGGPEVICIILQVITAPSIAGPLRSI